MLLFVCGSTILELPAVATCTGMGQPLTLKTPLFCEQDYSGAFTGEPDTWDSARSWVLVRPQEIMRQLHNNTVTFAPLKTKIDAIQLSPGFLWKTAPKWSHNSLRYAYQPRNWVQTTLASSSFPFVLYVKGDSKSSSAAVCYFGMASFLESELWQVSRGENGLSSQRFLKFHYDGTLKYRIWNGAEGFMAKFNPDHV